MLECVIKYFICWETRTGLCKIYLSYDRILIAALRRFKVSHRLTVSKGNTTRMEVKHQALHVTFRGYCEETEV